MFESLLLVLALAFPNPNALPGANEQPAARARKYLDDGVQLMRLERYPESLEKLNLAVSIARFARFETALQGETLRMASMVALLAHDSTKAIELAKAFLEWTGRYGSPADHARASVDRLMAYLLHGNRDAAEGVLAETLSAVEAADDPEQRSRFAMLVDPESGALKNEITSDNTAVAPPIATTKPASKPLSAQSTAMHPTSDRRQKSVRQSSESVSPLTRLNTPELIPADATQTRDEMVLIAAGTSQLGQADGEADERPVVEVYLPAFYIDRYEVTYGEFERFVAATGHVSHADWRVGAGADGERLPIRSVTWSDAMAFAAWRGKRLPTEAEWERAARGPNNWPYAFGPAYVLTAARTGMPEAMGPAAVGSYPANPLGLYDLTGNVLEWCADWYDSEAYSKPLMGNTRSPNKGTLRVIRGGAWNSDRDSARVSNRFAAPPEQSSPRVGFRCAKDAE